MGSLVLLDNPVPQEQWEIQDLQEIMDKRDLLVLLDQLASREIQDSQDQLDLPDLQVLMANLAKEVSRETQVQLVMLARLEELVFQEIQVSQEMLVLRGLWDLLEAQAIQHRMDRKELRVTREHLVQLVHRDQQGFRHKGILVSLDLQEHLVPLDNLVLLVSQDNQVK